MAEKQTIFDEKQVSLSVFASKILRHQPKRFGVTLDDNKFCNLADLLKGIKERFKHPVTDEEIVYVLRNSMWYDHHRFEIDGDKVRATYKHTYNR